MTDSTGVVGSKNQPMAKAWHVRLIAQTPLIHRNQRLLGMWDHLKQKTGDRSTVTRQCW
jgi:hypothetical protein